MAWRETQSKLTVEHPSGLTTLCGTASTWSQSKATAYGKCGKTLKQASAKTTRSYDITEQDLQRIVAELATPPPASSPESPFLRELGKPGQSRIPPQNATLMQRAVEEWERTICENKAVAILDQIQKGRPALIQEDGGDMLIAIVLDRPLLEAQALVENPTAFLREITKVLSDKQNHPVLQQMLHTIQDDKAKGAASSTSNPKGHATSEQDQFQ